MLNSDFFDEKDNKKIEKLTERFDRKSKKIYTSCTKAKYDKKKYRSDEIETRIQHMKDIIDELLFIKNRILDRRQEVTSMVYFIFDFNFILCRLTDIICNTLNVNIVEFVDFFPIIIFKRKLEIIN